MFAVACNAFVVHSIKLGRPRCTAFGTFYCVERSTNTHTHRGNTQNTLIVRREPQNETRRDDRTHDVMGDLSIHFIRPLAAFECYICEYMEHDARRQLTDPLGSQRGLTLTWIPRTLASRATVASVHATFCLLCITKTVAAQFKLSVQTTETTGNLTHAECYVKNHKLTSCFLFFFRCCYRYTDAASTSRIRPHEIIAST